MTLFSSTGVRASLVIVTHNNRAQVEVCLRSALGSPGPADELITLDEVLRG